MTAPRLAIITTCTARKVVSQDVVSLAGIPARPNPTERASQWVDSLSQASGKRLPVEQVYKGDHWQESLRALAVARARGFDASLWVLSAGYGLLPVAKETLILPYAATFGVNGTDSVARDVPPSERQDYHLAWWLALRRQRALAGFGQRSLAEVARSHGGNVTMLIIASDTYLRVIVDEVQAAASEMADRSALTVLSAGASDARRRLLSPYLLNTDSRLQRLLGGTRISLNVRTATWLLDRVDPLDFRRERLIALLQAELASLPHLAQRPVIKMTDAEVRAYIISELAQGEASATVLLQRLRTDQGKSCEQKRFRQLYEQSVGEAVRQVCEPII